MRNIIVQWGGKWLKNVANHYPDEEVTVVSEHVRKYSPFLVKKKISAGHTEKQFTTSN